MELLQVHRGKVRGHQAQLETQAEGNQRSRCCWLVSVGLCVASTSLSLWKTKKLPWCLQKRRWGFFSFGLVCRWCLTSEGDSSQITAELLVLQGQQLSPEEAFPGTAALSESVCRSDVKQKRVGGAETGQTDDGC